MGITSLPEWSACRAIPSWPKRRDAAMKIYKAASAAQLDELISIVESGGSDDQHVALSALEHFSRAKLDARWTAAHRDRLVHVLRKHVVEQYPDDLARHSVSVVDVMDFAWLDEFLTGIPLTQVSEEDRPKLVYDLSNHRTERSRERLLLMMEAGWRSWGGAKVDWPMKAAPGSLPPQPPSDEWDYNPHTSITGPLLGSPEWKHLLKSQNPLQEALLWLDSIMDSDLESLVEAWEGEDPSDQRCVGIVIRQMAQQNDLRLTKYRARILKQAQSVAAKVFQESGFLPSEYYVIRDVDREQAIDFVLSRLNNKESSLKHLQSAFAEMAALGGPRVVAHIEQLAAQSGPMAQAADTFLDERGPVTPEKIAAKSARWHKNRLGQDLKWLFFRHIEPQTKQGSSIEAILTLLGEPSKRGERFCEWKSKDSPVHSIYLETDKFGKLDWMRFYINNDAI